MIYVNILIICCVIPIKFKKKDCNLDKIWQIVSCDYLMLNHVR